MGTAVDMAERLAHLPRRTSAKHGDPAFSGEVFVSMTQEVL